MKFTLFSISFLLASASAMAEPSLGYPSQHRCADLQAKLARDGKLKLSGIAGLPYYVYAACPVGGGNRYETIPVSFRTADVASCRLGNYCNRIIENNN